MSWSKWVDKRWYEQCLNEMRCLIVCEFASSDKLQLQILYSTDVLVIQNACDFLLACHPHAPAMLCSLVTPSIAE